MIQRLPLAFLLLLSSPITAAAAEIKLWPADLVLTGPHAHQQLSVLAQENGKYVADLTAKAVYVSSNPKVAAVDAAGEVRAVGDGQAIITVRHEARQVTATGKGCRGRETIYLELPQPRHPAADQDRLQLRGLPRRPGRQGRLQAVAARLRPGGRPLRPDPPGPGPARRPAAAGPEPVLLKPTLAVPHGGGQKLEVGSPDYQRPGRLDRRRRPGPAARTIRHPAAGSLPADGGPQAQGHAAGARPGLVLRRPCRGRDALGQVQQQRGPGRRRRPGRQGQAWPATARRPSPSGTPTWSPPAGSSSPLPNTVDPQALRRRAAAQLHRRAGAEEAGKPAHSAVAARAPTREFIRRAYLDAAGILPTPEEVQQVPRRPAPRTSGPG